MPPRIFYRPKLNPQFVTDSENFAKWVAQWTGPEGIKPPGHGQIEVGHLNAEDAFVHTPETNKAWHEYVDQKAGNYGDVRAASEEWFKSQGLENKVEITPHSVALEGNTNRDPIGDFTKDLFDMGGPNSRVPLGAHAYDPKGLIKWGALGAGIAGTAAAGDALASPSRVSGPQGTPLSQMGDPIELMQQGMMAPSGSKVDDYLHGAMLAAMPPSPTQIQSMGPIEQLKQAKEIIDNSGIREAITLAAKGKFKASRQVAWGGMKNSVDALAGYGEMLKTPQGQVMLASMILPWAGKHGLQTYRDLMPPPARGLIHGLVRRGAPMTYLPQWDRKVLQEGVLPPMPNPYHYGAPRIKKNFISEAEAAVRSELYARAGLNPKGDYGYPRGLHYNPESADFFWQKPLGNYTDPRQIHKLTGKAYIENTPEGRKLQDFYHFWPGFQNNEGIPLTNIRAGVRKYNELRKLGSKRETALHYALPMTFPWVRSKGGSSIEEAARILYRKFGKPYLINASIEDIPLENRTWLQKLYWDKMMAQVNTPPPPR